MMKEQFVIKPAAEVRAEYESGQQYYAEIQAALNGITANMSRNGHVSGFPVNNTTIANVIKTEMEKHGYVVSINTGDQRDPGIWVNVRFR